MLSALHEASSEKYNRIVLDILSRYRSVGKVDFLEALVEKFLETPLSLKSQREIELLNLFPRAFYNLVLPRIESESSINGTPQSNLKKGIFYLMNRQYSEADGLFNKVASFNELSQYARYLLANSARLQHQYQKSKSLLDGLLQVEPKNGLFLHRLGLLEQDQKHFESAKRIFKQVFELEPEQDYALLQLAWIDVEQHQYPDAIKSFENALKIDPFDPYIYSGLGDIHSILGHQDLAIEYYQKALKINPYIGHIWKNLSITFVEKKQYIQAEGTISHLKELDPEKIDAYLVYAWLYEARNEYKRAITYLQEGLKYNPHSADLFLEIAKCFECLNDERQEFWALQQALRHDPLHNSVHIALGYYYLNREDYNEAIRHFQQSLKQDPMNISSLNGLSSCIYQKDQNLDETIRLLQKAISIDENNLSTLMNLGQIYFQEAKYEESESFLNRALTFDPQSSTILHLLGLIAWNFHENDQDTQNYLEKAHNIDPLNLAIAIDLSDFYLQRLRDPKKAQSVIQKFLNQQPNDPFIQKIVREIQDFDRPK